ncbi:hypothetical protein E2562_027935 [Oryza meyeriana var. granulata]|uniref:Uncharacterized protein n=1 Tax=Oryza meyeriana var. granulata TaxID=110450 RepID=A0A6G1CTP0_9ORYZ|nr:hypothetical protein E2562_027935 [Oryza meyeriana var. granulata]
MSHYASPSSSIMVVFPLRPRAIDAGAAAPPIARPSPAWLRRKLTPPHTRTHTHDHAWRRALLGSVVTSARHSVASMLVRALPSRQPSFLDIA